MHPHETQEFAALMALLGEVFRVEMTPTLLEIYRRLLDRFTIEEISVAVWHTLEHSTYFPMPAQLIEALEQVNYRRLNRERDEREEREAEERRHASQ